MRVLWFTNCIMPDYAKERLLPCAVGGGWMSALLCAIRQYAPEIRLSIAFETKKSDFAKIEGVDYYALGSRNDSEFQSNVENCLQVANPDVIHIHGTENIAQVLPESVFRHKRVVLSLQGIMDACAKNYFGGLTWSELKRFENPIRRLLHRLNVQQIAAEWLKERTPKECAICERVRFFMGRTKFDANWIHCVNPKARYFHVDEILRPEFYQGRTWSADPQGHVIYAGAAFSYPLKGGHWLLRALAIVKRRYPDVELRVAASQNCISPRLQDRIRRGEYQRYLIDLVDKLDLRANVIFLPSLSAGQVRKELERANVYCLASTMENSPNSLCEAQMVGTPVVTTNVGGVRDFVQDGRTGYLVPPCSPEALAHTLGSVFRMKKTQLETMTTDAYFRAVQRHDSRRIIQDLLQAYRFSEDKL